MNREDLMLTTLIEDLMLTALIKTMPSCLFYLERKRLQRYKWKRIYAGGI